MDATDKKPHRRLKVAVLNRNFTPTAGGAERYSMALVEELASLHEMHVFAQTIDHSALGVTYHRIPLFSSKPRWLNQLWYALATWRATRKGFDIIHSHEAVWFGNVQTMHVKTVQRSLLGGRRGWVRVLRWLKIATSPRLQTYLSLEHARLKLQPQRAVVAASQLLADELAQEYTEVSAMLSVVTPGVNLPTSCATKKEARSALSVKSDGRIVLFVANDYVRKGLPALLQAMQHLPNDVRLLVVGNASQIPVFSAQAAALNLSERVQFLGPLSKMDVAYCAADVLCHPTLEDSFGMVVLEAMAYSLPVVVSGAAHCGLSALLAHERHALLLDNPQDAVALAGLLRRLFGDDNLRRELTLEALNFAQQHTWKHAAHAYDVIYQQVAAQL